MKPTEIITLAEGSKLIISSAEGAALSGVQVFPEEMAAVRSPLELDAHPTLTLTERGSWLSSPDAHGSHDECLGSIPAPLLPKQSLG